ncbi:MAG: hypothetical protein NT045_04080 [Candidatus Aureabacteria bacterium]|nr:hypothetical protein [Candidatus Auribacterota bacterium]
MSLEDKILGMEEEAAGVVAGGRAEAKRMLATLDANKEQIRKEIAARVEVEKVHIQEEYGRSQEAALAEIARASRHALKEIEDARAEKAPRMARSLLTQLLGE